MDQIKKEHLRARNNSDTLMHRLDGSTTMLDGGVPKVNTETASRYAIGSLTVLDAHLQ